MQLVWGPASRDDLWGNAILTTAPIISTDWIKFDTTQNLRRGAVVAVLESTEGTISVISTHLDNPRGATAARQEQVAQLIELWDCTEPAVIGGDFNADPDSETIIALLESGLGDTGEVLGVDATTSEDDRRIDYVLVTPGLEVVSSEIPDTWASDHRPFVTTLRVMP
jgi:endonuclease/exonuclease/phosphatase family metal-dependent hydrolase